MSDAESTTSGDGRIDRLKGTVKQVAGTITGNDELKREGELHHHRADAAKDAVRLMAAADREQDQAEVIAREQEIDIERARLEAETGAETREQQIEHERLAEEQRVAADEQRREAAVEQQAIAQQEALDRQERQVAVERADAERHASQLQAEAAEAARTAAQLDSASEEIA